MQQSTLKDSLIALSGMRTAACLFEPRSYVYIYISVRVLPSVSKRLLEHTIHQAAGGPGTHDCLSWPTKTRQHGGESVSAEECFSNSLLTDHLHRLLYRFVCHEKNLLQTQHLLTPSYP